PGHTPRGDEGAVAQRVLEGKEVADEPGRVGAAGRQRAAVEDRDAGAALDPGRDDQVGRAVAVEVAQRRPAAAAEVRVAGDPEEPRQLRRLAADPGGELRPAVDGDDRPSALVRGDDDLR